MRTHDIHLPAEVNYSETIDYLFSRLPMYQRKGKAAYKADLSNTIKLCELLGNPERQFPAIHIGGTNGKGSTASLLASILQEAGFKTGLFTSPHLKDFRERIRINGQLIPEESVVNFVAEKKELLDEISPSLFEWTAGLAFHHFAEQQVDLSVVEVGLGGRLDSTNVVNSIVTCITSIGMDHADLLGDTLQKIALEKAGIAKKEVPLIIPQKIQDVVLDTIKNKAASEQAPLTKAKALRHPSLAGEHQYQNAGCVFEIIQQLRQQGKSIDDTHIALGIEHVRMNTGLRGRWELLSENPKTIADVAHNREGIEAMLKLLAQESYEQLHIVFGAVNDKDLDAVLPLFPKDANYYFCEADIPRALDVNALSTSARSHGLEGDSYQSVSTALEAAQSCASQNDLVLVSGSVFVVAEVL